jgi:fructose-bisphosphate aldolase class II
MISDSKLTDPSKASAFISGWARVYSLSITSLIHSCSTGAIILAPSIGNLHGSYLNPPNFRQDMFVLSSLRVAIT